RITMRSCFKKKERNGESVLDGIDQTPSRKKWTTFCMFIGNQFFSFFYPLGLDRGRWFKKV
ncbi:MAG: hypothetical protein KAI90_08385, partial [Desulfobulbaceae bacterium]|nr:hypothetical protein [Desulfobulbaceae bacterium]